MSTSRDAPRPRPDKLPISPPERSAPAPAADEPDLHLEEIEDKHVPKDRNIFDK